VGAFVAVTAVVLGITVAVSLNSHHGSGPSAAPSRIIARPAAALENLSRPSPGGLSSQIPDTSAAAQQTELLTKSGVLVAHGDQFRIYRLQMPKPVTVQVAGRSLTTRTVYRIDIAAGPYQVRDMPNVVSINNRPLAVGLESSDLATLRAFTFDKSVLTEGATLQVSYGLATKVSTTWNSKIEVNR
jgi:hypothetical protein